MDRTTLTVDLNIIAQNAKNISKAVTPSKIMAVVKANAYGLGVIPIVKRLDAEGFCHFAISSAKEAIELRNHFPKIKIYQIGICFKEEVEDLVKNQVTIGCSSGKMLSYIGQVAKKMRRPTAINWLIDTGMGRLGTPYNQWREEWKKMLPLLSENKYISLTGIYSHFSSSERKNDAYTNSQIKKFKTLREDFLENISKDISQNFSALSDFSQDFPQDSFQNSPQNSFQNSPQDFSRNFSQDFSHDFSGNSPQNPPKNSSKQENSIKFHFCNSKGVINYPDQHFDMVRCGISIYGCNLCEDKPFVKTKVSYQLFSHIIDIRTLPKGHAIGYNHLHRLAKTSRVATISAGFADGIPMQLINQKAVIIRGEKVKVIGKVSMDYTAVLLPPHSKAKVGDKAIFLGQSGKEKICIEDWAKWKKTNVYEPLTIVGIRAKRLYFPGENS